MNRQDESSRRSVVPPIHRGDGWPRAMVCTVVSMVQAERAFPDSLQKYVKDEAAVSLLPSFPLTRNGEAKIYGRRSLNR